MICTGVGEGVGVPASSKITGSWFTGLLTFWGLSGLTARCGTMASGIWALASRVAVATPESARQAASATGSSGHRCMLRRRAHAPDRGSSWGRSRTQGVRQPGCAREQLRHMAGSRPRRGTLRHARAERCADEVVSNCRTTLPAPPPPTNGPPRRCCNRKPALVRFPVCGKFGSPRARGSRPFAMRHGSGTLRLYRRPGI